MLKLFFMELTTTITRKSLVLLFLLFLLFLSFNIYNNYEKNDHHHDWKSKVQNDIKIQTQKMSDKNNTNEVKKYFATNIQKNKMYLEKNINPYEKNQYTFMQGNLNFLSFIPIFILFISSFIVYKEYKYNVIKNIKMSNVSSFKVIMSKFIAMVFILSLIFLFTYIITFSTGVLVNNYTGFNYEIITQKQNLLESKNAFIYISKVFIADYLVSIFLISFIFMLISLTKSSTLSVLTSILLLVLHKNISEQLSSFHWTKYLFFNTLDFRKVLIQTNSFDFTSDIIIILIMNVIYIILFLIISILFFKKIKT